VVVPYYCNHIKYIIVLCQFVNVKTRGTFTYHWTLNSLSVLLVNILGCCLMKDTTLKQRENCIFTNSLLFEMFGFDMKGVDSTCSGTGESVSIPR
jgi:hypothetical protein